jgi:hypothetical protein
MVHQRSDRERNKRGRLYLWKGFRREYLPAGRNAEATYNLRLPLPPVVAARNRGESGVIGLLSTLSRGWGLVFYSPFVRLKYRDGG